MCLTSYMWHLWHVWKVPMSERKTFPPIISVDVVVIWDVITLFDGHDDDDDDDDDDDEDGCGMNVSASNQNNEVFVAGKFYLSTYNMLISKVC
jgi:hypothetical protein